MRDFVERRRPSRPVTVTRNVPGEASVPAERNSAAPWAATWGRFASVSTLLTSVGCPATPCWNGRGGFVGGFGWPAVDHPHRRGLLAGHVTRIDGDDRDVQAAEGVEPDLVERVVDGQRRRPVGDVDMARCAPTNRAARRTPSSTRCGRCRSNQRSFTEAGSPSSPLATTTVS